MRCASLTLILVLFLGSEAASQTISGEVPVATNPVRGLVALGEEARSDLRPADALHAFREALAQDPESYEALWRAAREAIALGGLTSSGDQAEVWFQAAEQYARRAAEANPEGVDGHLWRAVAVGRLALTQGPREKVRLAVEIREHALRTLELDSLNAGAHHVLGEWHAEIRRLSGITRWAARRFLGADVFDLASWEQAEHHLTQAVAADPYAATHQLDLARLYLDLDRREEAETHLRRVLELPVTDPEDPLHKQQARALLEEAAG